MTSRMSSGSSRCDSAVEPTRSMNITVNCRRSARGDADWAGDDTLDRGELGCPFPWSPEATSMGRWVDILTEGSNGGEQLAPVTNRGDPERHQVLGRQLWKHLSFDVVVAESRRVLLQPEAPQPYRDVHAPPPNRQRGLLRYFIPICTGVVIHSGPSCMSALVRASLQLLRGGSGKGPQHDFRERRHEGLDMAQPRPPE